MKQSLNAWMNGELVGTWFTDRGSHSFRYAESWLTSEHRRPLSLSIPISSSLEVRGLVVKNYFDNLLPDNQRIRERLGKRFNAKNSTFELLQAIGRDCVGAVQLLPENDVPEQWREVRCQPIDSSDISELLKAVPLEAHSSETDDFFRISIAGAQEKTALTSWGGRWCRPYGSTPTTHILKLPLGFIPVSGSRVDASDSVQNEWLCAQIVRELGLPVATTSIERFEEQLVLVVTRFDRSLMDDGQWIARLPQEDFCQALGVPPSMKYESQGGPGMQKCLQLLQGSANPNDGILFLLAQLAFFLLAAPDAHAKNFSIFLQRDNKYEMTPLYDILSAWPYMGLGPNKLQSKKVGLAMAIRSKNAHYALSEIQTRHWYGLAMKNGGSLAWDAMTAMVEGVDDALAKVESQLPEGFPEDTWLPICRGMKEMVQRFKSQPLR